MRKRNLKCPHCRGHHAWVELLYNERRDEYYRQKFCSCGYAGTKRYTGITHQRMAELRKELNNV